MSNTNAPAKKRPVIDLLGLSKKQLTLVKGGSGVITEGQLPLP